MKLESYTFVLNDEKILPFFLNYYTPILDKMTFMDSGSTDRTIDIIKSYGHEVTQTGLTFWDWDTMRNIYQNIWKKSKSNYVFLMDADEFFYHSNLREFLEESKDNIDIYQMEGYQMVANKFPEPNTNIFDINMGVRLPLYDKSTIFNPKVDIYHENAHEIVTTSKRICRRVIKLLHYKFLGVDILKKRTELIKKRVPKNSYCKYINGNILSVYPAFIKSDQQWQDEINQLLSQAEQVI
jgi:glycosyltransferase involved in cell wall biosynthesis